MLLTIGAHALLLTMWTNTTLQDTSGSRSNLAVSPLHLAAGTGDVARVNEILAEAGQTQQFQIMEEEDSLGRTPLVCK